VIVWSFQVFKILLTGIGPSSCGSLCGIEQHRPSQNGMQRRVNCCTSHGMQEARGSRTSSMSRDQAIFVDQATGASLSWCTVVLEIDRFG
jgi:hypothetical protein